MATKRPKAEKTRTPSARIAASPRTAGPRPRRVKAGDVGPTSSPEAVETYAVGQASAGATEAQGVPAGQLAAEGKGDAEPIADNATSEGRAQNRRVEFVPL